MCYTAPWTRGPQKTRDRTTLLIPENLYAISCVLQVFLFCFQKKSITWIHNARFSSFCKENQACNIPNRRAHRAWRFGTINRQNGGCFTTQITIWIPELQASISRSTLSNLLHTSYQVEELRELFKMVCGLNRFDGRKLPGEGGQIRPKIRVLPYTAGGGTVSGTGSGFPSGSGPVPNPDLARFIIFFFFIFLSIIP